MTATTTSTIDRGRNAEGAGDEEFEAGIAAAEGEAGGGIGGVAARHAAIDQQAAQRHDEGLHLELGDQQAVGEPDARRRAPARSAAPSARARPSRPTRSTNSTPSSAIIEPTESSMPPVMMTKPWRDGEQAEQADQVGGVGEVVRRQEQRVAAGRRRAPTTRIRTSRPRSFLFMCARPRAAERLADGEQQDVLLAELVALEHAGDRGPRA